MPEYFASNAFAIFSASCTSTEVYQTTLPSWRAAAISDAVTTVGSGAPAPNGEAAAATAAVPLSTARRDREKPIIILVPPDIVLTGALRRRPVQATGIEIRRPLGAGERAERTLDAAAGR